MKQFKSTYSTVAARDTQMQAGLPAGLADRLKQIAGAKAMPSAPKHLRAVGEDYDERDIYGPEEAL